MADRFYFSGELVPDVIELLGGEAQHLSRVLRKQAGQRVMLFDGRGTEAEAEIVEVAKRSVRLQVLAVGSAERGCAVGLELATAVPKGDRLRWLVEKATELGVARITPMRCERSVVDPGAGKLEKMRQVVIEACKQCGRNRLMEIGEVVPFAECLRGDGHRLLADRQGFRTSVESERFAGAECVRVIVGPEGGFTSEETDLARAAGVERVSFGRHILRIETAGVAAAAWFAAQGGGES